MDGLYSTFLLNWAKHDLSVQRPDGRALQIIEVGLIIEQDFGGKLPADSSTS